MNELHPSFPPMPATTQAAEGMARRAWTVAEIEAMVEAGIIEGDERFELIGGEAVPMLPKGGRHEMVKLELNRHFQKTAADDLTIAQETTLRLDQKTFLEPDFCVFPRRLYPGDLRGYHVLLAIEVSDASFGYDSGRKSASTLPSAFPRCGSSTPARWLPGYTGSSAPRVLQPSSRLARNRKSRPPARKR